MIALGLLTAAAWRLPGALLLLVAFALVVFRGAANASGIKPGIDATLFAAGYVVLTLLIAAVEAFRRSDAGWHAIAVRAGGSWIAAIGVMAGGATPVR